MYKTIRLMPVMALALLAACVTINVYFPAVAAERAADRIIDDVWGKNAPRTPPGDQPAPQSRSQTPDSSGLAAVTAGAAVALLDFVLPAAHAAEPVIDIDTPAVQNIVASMEQRHAQLKPYYESGAIGLTQRATIEIHNMGTVSLARRNQLKQLVAEENADRNALYREIAVANNHPEWESQIRATFAERWISKAQPGWYYQSKNGWQQK